MIRRFRCLDGFNSPFATGRIYTLQSETENAYYFDGVKGGWPKGRFVEVPRD